MAPTWLQNLGQPFGRRGSLAGLWSPGPPATVEATLADFFELKDRYLRSASRDQTLALLRQYRPGNGWEMSKAILVGVGRFAAASRKQERYRSTLQLIIFLDIVDNIEDKATGRIKMYAQELHFSNIEQEVLDFLNVEIVIDPQAQKMCGPGVFVLAPYCIVDVEMVCQCLPYQPSLFVGVSMEDFLRREQRWTNVLKADIEQDGDRAADAKRRLPFHIRRMDLMRRWEETHTEVKMPSYRGLVDEEGMWLQVQKPDAPAHGQTCDLCQDRDGRRFGYRHGIIADPSKESEPEWD